MFDTKSKRGMNLCTSCITCTCTVHVQCTCTVRVLYMYCTCTVHVRVLYMYIHVHVLYMYTECVCHICLHVTVNASSWPTVCVHFMVLLIMILVQDLEVLIHLNSKYYLKLF